MLGEKIVGREHVGARPPPPPPGSAPVHVSSDGVDGVEVEDGIEIWHVWFHVVLPQGSCGSWKPGKSGEVREWGEKSGKSGELILYLGKVMGFKMYFYAYIFIMVE